MGISASCGLDVKEKDVVNISVTGSCAVDTGRSEDDKPDYTVCGGTFLYLILQALSPESKKRGVNNFGITESNCFLELVKLGQKSCNIVAVEDTISQETSKFKHCKMKVPSWLPIKEESYIESLNNRVENDYENLLQDTILWADRFLNLPQHADFLGKALIELFFFDRSLDPENTFLNANSDGSKISVMELVKADHIFIQPLIIGIWHHVVNHKVTNTDGRTTIETISDNKGIQGAVRKKRKIGKAGISEFRVRILNPLVEKDSNGNVKQARQRRTRNERIFHAQPDDSERTGQGADSEERTRLFIDGDSIALSDDEFNEYLNSLYSAYKTVKTLLYRQEPRDFDEIYLPNDIETTQPYWLLNKDSYDSARKALKNADITTITHRSNFIIISGIGGLGKSMMMRHLLLDAIANYKRYKLVPIFIPLKDYRTAKGSLFDFIYEIFESFDGGKSRDELEDIMRSGRCVLLFDGLDEIKSEYRQEFERQLEKLTNGYRKNIFIMSSRPYTHYVSFGRFVKMNLLPFTKEQSVALIEKLDMGKEEEPVKQEFKKELEESLYDTHQEFAENPLLLTIMLMTYKSYAKIPVKMHKFYSKAYDTLFSEHDVIKVGYDREYKTKMTQDRFAEYFDEFCFLSYQEGNIDLTPEECQKFFSELEAVQEDKPNFTWRDFIDDLTDSVCMMYEEGQKYHFLHRSFQEYFCARYFYRQDETNLWEIAMFFDDMDVKETDKTFAMLYDMKPKPIEDNVFLPFLEEIFKYRGKEITERNLILCYRDFLLKFYPTLYLDEGEVPGYSVVKPSSYIYSFIVRTNNLNEDLSGYEYDSIPSDAEVVDEYAYYDPEVEERVVNVDEDGNGDIEYCEGDNPDLYSVNELSTEYLEHFDYPDIEGTTYKVELKNAFEHEEDDVDNLTFIAELMDEEYPLLKEFKNVYAYYLTLQERSKTRKADLRSKLKKKK